MINITIANRPFSNIDAAIKNIRAGIKNLADVINDFAAAINGMRIMNMSMSAWRRQGV